MRNRLLPLLGRALVMTLVGCLVVVGLSVDRSKDFVFPEGDNPNVLLGQFYFSLWIEEKLAIGQYTELADSTLNLYELGRDGFVLLNSRAMSGPLTNEAELERFTIKLSQINRLGYDVKNYFADLAGANGMGRFILFSTVIYNCFLHPIWSCIILIINC